jgi:hypothetical protein
VASVLLLIVVRVWGLSVAEQALQQRDGGLKLRAVPLFGEWNLLLTWRLLVPLVLGAVLVIVLPRLSQQITWRPLVALVAVAAAVWSLTLQFVDVSWRGLQAYGAHINVVDERGGPAAFVRTYVEFQAAADVPVHLRSHPPGLVLWLWASDQIGLSGKGYESMLALAGVAVSVVAVLVITRSVAGERFARHAAPFVVLAPAALWHSNADVVFGGVALTGVAMIAVAAGKPAAITWRNTGSLLAVAGGAVFGLALLLSYSAALLAIPIAVITLWRRAWTTLATSTVSGLVVVLLPLLAGFWWLDGLIAISDQYEAGVASVRPYTYFVIANVAVLVLALGPATIAGLVQLRDWRAWLVVGSGIAAVVAADISGMTKAEVERIWQPLIPLILVAGAAVGYRLGLARWWLGAQLTVTMAIQAVLRTPW